MVEPEFEMPQVKFGWEHGDDLEYAETPDGLLITSDERRIVDGEEWFPVMGMAGDEWVRTINGRTNGNPHILRTWGTDKWGDYQFSMSDDWDGPEDGRWVPAVPYTFRGFDFTEYDTEYGEEYDTFEEAVRAGKELAKVYARFK